MRLFFDCVIGLLYLDMQASQVVLVVKNPPANAGDVRDVGSIPGSGRSPRGGNGNLIQYSSPENPMDGGAWQVTDRVAKSQTQLKKLNTHTHTHAHTHTHTPWCTTLNYSSSISWVIISVVTEILCLKWTSLSLLEYIYYICCCCSVAKSCLTLCNPMNCSTSGFPVLHSPSWLKLMSVESVMSSNHVVLCHPLLLPSIFSSIRDFSNESAVPIRWPKYWSFSFSISPSNEYSGLISFRIDWFDLLAVQGTLRSLLQHHSSKDQFFGTQPSFWSSSHICI